LTTARSREAQDRYGKVQGPVACIIIAEAQEKDVLDLIHPDDTRPYAGLDTGLTALLTDSEGNEYDPPAPHSDHKIYP